MDSLKISGKVQLAETGNTFSKITEKYMISEKRFAQNSNLKFYYLFELKR